MLNFPVGLSEFATVQNYVGTGNIGYLIDLPLVYKKCRPNVFYDHEIFTGAIYKMKQFNLTCLMFYSGKYVLTGSRCIDDLKRANKFLQILLKSYKNKI